MKKITPVSSGRGRGQGRCGLLSLFRSAKNKDLSLNNVKKEKAFDFKQKLNYVKEKASEHHSKPVFLQGH